MRPPALRAVALSAFAIVFAACGGSGVTTERADQVEGPGNAPTSTDVATTSDDPGTSAPGGPTVSTTPGADPFGWRELYPGVETGLLDVPIDYEDPSAGTFELFVARRLADDPANRIGTLLVNPGGPGFGGSDYAIYADQIYDAELLRHFDIIGWDPRGTGLSEPAIDCVDDYDRYFANVDITPDDEAERQQIIDLAEEFADNCAAKNGEFFEYVGTNNSARDMNAIREALGEETISYFGFSYGSELGGTWATLFPETVRAAVLDGAADPNADAIESSLQQVRGFEGTLTSYLADCSADPGCPFHNDGDAEGAFDALMARLDEEPIPSVPGRPDVTRGVALQGVTDAMYSDQSWHELSVALADAQRGNGSGLLALYDSYYQRRPDGTWGNELEAFQTISCMDTPERLTVEEEDETAPLFNEAGPRFAPGTTGSYFCTFYPPAIDPRAEITGAGAGPIVVIGATGDAATPLASTRAMAAALEDGRLVVVTADQHTGYGVNSCVDDVVHRYLVDLEIPAEETDC